MDDAEEWVRTYVEPTGAIETAHVRPWGTVRRVPVGDTALWLKACDPEHAFETRLTALLAHRWPGRVADVLAHDDERAWLLMADAGRFIGISAPPHLYLDVLARYAELQRGEAGHAQDHVDHGVSDLRLAVLPKRYEAMVARDLPLTPDEHARLRRFTPRLRDLCDELAARDIPETVQHDDLHGNNIYGQRVLDWGDSSIAHPFFSLVVPCRFVGEQRRLRDAYLEPWGRGHEESFALAYRVGWVAHAIAATRQLDQQPQSDRPLVEPWVAHILRQALKRTVE
jgi:Phosphotransferase enzyme family